MVLLRGFNAHMGNLEGVIGRNVLIKLNLNNVFCGLGNKHHLCARGDSSVYVIRDQPCGRTIKFVILQIVGESVGYLSIVARS